MKSLQNKYNLIKEGKGNKELFLKEARTMFPNVVTGALTFDQAIHNLTERGIISEGFIGVSSQRAIEPNWFKIFNENVDVKATIKQTDKSVVEKETAGYDYKDKKSNNNISTAEILTGYYAEMKNPKNADKTETEIKAIVFKNLEKDPLHYVKGGQFGIEGVGYTEEAPGLGKPKEAKGKYKSSGMEPVKLTESKSKIKAGDIIKHKLTGAKIKVKSIAGSNIEGTYVELGDMEGKVKKGDTVKTNINLIGKTYELNEVFYGSSDGDFDANQEDIQMANYNYDKGLEAYSEGDFLKADRYYTAALRYGSYLGWTEKDLPPYEKTTNESLDEIDSRTDKYDTEHGSPYDRGHSDAWYERPKNPHKWVNGEEVKLTDPEELEAYNAGYDECQGTKDWGDAEDYLQETDDVKKKLMPNKQKGVADAIVAKSTLEKIAAEVWGERDVNKAKEIFKKHIQDSKMNDASKKQMLYNLSTITTKTKLDYYLANSLLSFEKLSVKEGIVNEMNLNIPQFLKDMIEEVTEDSKNGYVQHIEYAGSGRYRISDWFDSDNTIYSVENGRVLLDKTNEIDAEGNWKGGMGEVKHAKTLSEAKKRAIEKHLKEIEKLGEVAAIDHKIQKIEEKVEELKNKITMTESDDFVEMVDKNAVKEIKKDIALLEKRKKVWEAQKARLTKGTKTSGQGKPQTHAGGGYETGMMEEREDSEEIHKKETEMARNAMKKAFTEKPASWEEAVKKILAAKEKK